MTFSSKTRHFFWRAGFGVPWKQWETEKDKSIVELVEKQFQYSRKVDDTIVTTELPPKLKELRAMSKDKRREFIRKSRRQVKALNLQWYQQMMNTRAQLREKMTLFWHGHFACRSKNIFHAQLQLNTLRKHALGNFHELVEAIAKDPAMLQYLNNQQNRKKKPNENFARELMELFTIGRGNYTEQDIKESARAFTGWAFDGNDFVFRSHLHDDGTKTFMGKTGNFNGEDIIKILLEKRQTARYIVGKVYKYFVNDTPNATVIEQLATQFYDSGYDISGLMKTIFMADWFYALENIGTKIKSPVEYLVGLQRELGLRFENENAVLFMQKVLGQMLLNPPNVAGWAGGQDWIDSSSLLFRMKLPETIYKVYTVTIEAKEEGDVTKKNIVQNKMRRLKASFDWQGMTEALKNKKGQEIIYQHLNAYLLSVNNNRSQEFVQKIAKNLSNEEFTKTASISLCSLPEYQMC